MRSMIPMQRHSTRTSSARQGFTLAELIVAMVLFSLVGGGILTVVMRQQRFYRSTAEIIQQQGQLRQGGNVLPLDLRMVSTSDTLVNGVGSANNADIYSRNDWSLEFRRTFGSSLVCAMRTAGTTDTIMLYPKALDDVAAVSSWGIAPVEGDSILILDDWTTVGPGDDRWRAYEVKSVTPVKGINGCPWKGKTPGDNTPLLALSDTVRFSYEVALATNTNIGNPTAAGQPVTIIVGAPVRFFRRVRYEIYQAGDTSWYLGYSDCLRTYGTWNGCSEVTPVAGPYKPYTGVASENGIVFSYYGANGNLLTSGDPSRLISRVDVLMRSQTRNQVTRTGSGPTEHYRDSLLFSIGIRNRR
jgi:prepilin-type N-terminal cleavage/methylation domain-containing protein